MKNRLLLVVVAALAITGCRKEPDPEPLDPYATFKTDATPRWERGLTTREPNETSHYTFITDESGTLFGSAKYKIGRTSNDGNDYEILEFSGVPAVGKPSDASIRKPLSGSKELYNLEIMKIEGNKLWIVFQETESSVERRVVQ